MSLFSRIVRSMMTAASLASCLALAVSGPARADGTEPDYVLPPIVKDASPVDSLSEDPIVPSSENVTGVSSGSGTIEQDIEDKLPYSVTDPGRAGSLTQFRGLGRSADDTGVQALGIPLNPPQGGGFDFTTLPQFLWSQYQLSLTPSPSALDPRAAAGTISLVPWTAQALAGSGAAAPVTRTRWSALYAGTDLQQLSVGTTYRDRLAVLAGNSSGLVSGPSGSLSALLAGSGAGAANPWSLKAHFLATDVEAQTYNFGFGESPQQTTTRLMPVLQLDASPAPSVVIKTSVFYDNSYIRYDDFSGNYFSRDRAQQYGAELAAFVGDWKFGAGSREVNYQITGFDAPAENVTDFMASRTMRWETGGSSELLLSPVVQGVYVTQFDFAPQASLGLREQWGDPEGDSTDGAVAVYTRCLYSRLFPTLADLYYSVPAVGSGNAILANPALEPEDDFTYVLGAEARSGIWKGGLELYYQVRDNAQVLVLSAPGAYQQQNAGQARLASLVASSSVHLTNALEIDEAANFTDSHVNELQSPYPYMPDFLNVLGVGFKPAASWIVSADTRIASSQYVDTSGGLPSTAFSDLQATYIFSNGVQLIGRIENVTGDDLVLEKDYAPKDRVFILSAVGAL